MFSFLRPRTISDRPYPTVDIVEWRPTGSDGRPTGQRNFGDHLARIITTRMLAARGHVIEEETRGQRRLLVIGSSMHFLDTGDTVWGGGVNGKIRADRHRWSMLDVRAVRGPLTAAFLAERGVPCPEVYGDPALLLPTLLPGRYNPRPERPYVLVPNLHDLPLVAENPFCVSPLRGWNHVVQEIMKAELVISSSLHGLIVADAYGIPARFLRLSETENLFKYRDYAAGVGRDGIEPACSVAEALEMGGMALVVFDPTSLLAAFPWDLWQEPV